MPFLSDLISVNHHPPSQVCQKHLNSASSSSSSTLSSYPLFLALFRFCFMRAAGQWIIPYVETIFFASPRSLVKAERANRGNKSWWLGFGTCRSAVSRSYERYKSQSCCSSQVLISCHSLPLSFLELHRGSRNWQLMWITPFHQGRRPSGQRSKMGIVQGGRRRTRRGSTARWKARAHKGWIEEQESVSRGQKGHGFLTTISVDEVPYCKEAPTGVNKSSVCNNRSPLCTK